MPQGSIIFFGLFIGFVVYVTLKGELSSYLAIFGIGKMPTDSTGGINPQAQIVGSSSGNVSLGTSGTTNLGSVPVVNTNSSGDATPDTGGTMSPGLGGESTMG